MDGSNPVASTAPAFRRNPATPINRPRPPAQTAPRPGFSGGAVTSPPGMGPGTPGSTGTTTMASSGVNPSRPPSRPPMQQPIGKSPTIRTPAPNNRPPQLKRPGTRPDGIGSRSQSESQGAPKQIMTKRKINEIVMQVDSRERVDPDAEDFLLELADEFLEGVVNFSCMLAKHRNSDTLEVKDVQQFLEKYWNIHIPGFSDDVRPTKKQAVTDAHKQRLQLVKKAIAQSREPKK